LDERTRPISKEATRLRLQVFKKKLINSGLSLTDFYAAFIHAGLTTR